MVLCFLLRSCMNNISSSVVPFQIMKISTFYPRNKRALPWLYGYIRFDSNCCIKILAYGRPQIVPISHPITCRSWEKLNIKLFKVRIRLRNMIITFVDTDLDGCLSEASLTALIPSLLRILVYKDLTPSVTSKLSFGICLILFNFVRKS